MNHRRSFLSISIFLLVSSALTGCVLVDDFDKYSFVDGGTRGIDSGPTLPQDCVEDFLLVGIPATTNTVGAGDDFTASCGGAGAEDVAFEFVAPRDDYYRFNTIGSSFDTVLSLVDATCDGSEAACNNNFGGAPTSEIVRRLGADETVIAIVDGNADFGDVTLNAEFVTCPSINLDAVTLPIGHTTIGQSDDNSGSCGGAERGDRAYRFTAPDDGFYRFEVLSDQTSFRSALYIEDGPECGGSLLQCNSGAERRSHVGREMSAGQVVTVRVDGDGADGAYDLDVKQLAAGTSCVDTTTSLGAPLVFSIPADGPHRMTTSCADTGVWHLGNSDPAQIHDFPDLGIGFMNIDPPGPGCSFGCTITITAQFPFAASITDGDSCEGAEQQCVSFQSANYMVSPNEFTADVSTPAADGRPKVLVIDRLLPDHEGIPMGYDHGDSVTIQMGCFGVC